MTISLRLATPPSDEELVELSERNPGLQFERTEKGELVVTPTGGEAGRRGAVLISQLHRWADLDGTGVVFGPSAGFHLPDGSLLSPDVSWVRRERWEALTSAQREGFAPLCPDAVFEVASERDWFGVLHRKMRAYVANGAIAVLIDPARRAVEIHLPGAQPRIVEDARQVSLDPVLPGFVLDLDPLFE
jgi:Uma2 family endonuclease